TAPAAAVAHPRRRPAAGAGPETAKRRRPRNGGTSAGGAARTDHPGAELPGRGGGGRAVRTGVGRDRSAAGSGPTVGAAAAGRRLRGARPAPAGLLPVVGSTPDPDRRPRPGPVAAAESVRPAHRDLTAGGPAAVRAR